MQVMRNGGAQNRAGSEFICEVKNSALTIKQIPFIFNPTQTYVLEFGNEYIRVIKEGVVQTLAAQSITGITNASTAVLTYSGSDTYANGNEVFITGVVGPIAKYVNNRNFKVAGVDTALNTFQLNYLNGTAVNSTTWGAYTSGGTVAEIYEIASPYLTADLPDLNYVQSADVITIFHKSYPTKNLSRTGDISWTLANKSYTPASAPAITIGNVGATGTTVYLYGITAIDAITGAETLAKVAATATGNATLTTVNYNTVVTDSIDMTLYSKFYIWRKDPGSATGSAYYLLDVYSNPGGSQVIYRDTGEAILDRTVLMPTDVDSFTPPYSTTNNYPATGTYYQQRLMVANTNLNTEEVQGSKIGAYNDFLKKTPIQEDDPVRFTMNGRQVNEVNYMIDLGKLLIFTSTGEHGAEGDGSGALTPTQINRKQYTYNGSAKRLPPIVIGDTALYVQARGTVIRSLGFTFQTAGYKGDELSIFSAHLFDDYSLVDWAYQQVPHSIVWVVRSDGSLVGLTFIQEQQVIAFHRHDFKGGLCENVCVVPEGNEDVLYVTVKRTINGAVKRYIERISSRQMIGTNVIDMKFMDSFLSYDGRNAGVRTMTLSGSGWTSNDTLTMTASSGFFTAADVGNQIFIYDPATGAEIRFTINAYTSTTVVTGKPHKDVPLTLQAVATTEWSRAVDELTGLWHLEGESVTVFGDGFVAANPNNPSYTVVTVANGTIILDKPYAVIHVGIPITADVETLDIDTANGETISDKKNLVGKVSINVNESRGIWVGGRPPPSTASNILQGLAEAQIRYEENYDDAVALKNGVVTVTIENDWNSNGRVFIRQTDPVPLTILSIMPTGLFPFKG